MYKMYGTLYKIASFALILHCIENRSHIVHTKSADEMSFVPLLVSTGLCIGLFTTFFHSTLKPHNDRLKRTMKHK